eukprot:scaffold181038_cov40-Prasinocladus_malaysianus.AAC.1
MITRVDSRYLATACMEEGKLVDADVFVLGDKISVDALEVFNSALGYLLPNPGRHLLCRKPAIVVPVVPCQCNRLHRHTPTSKT